MIQIPIQSPDHKNDALIVILTKQNLDRMAVADPADVPLSRCGKTLVNPRIMICHEEDSPELTRLLHGRDVEAILKFLTRGFAFRPDLGDHDNPPTRLQDGN